MSGKKPSLGRGLAELSPLLARRAGMPAAEKAQVLVGDRLSSLPVDLLQRGKYQPRVDMRQESLGELADSIKSRGLVQPILVRPLPRPNPNESQRYEIIAGERRWRAAQMAGLSEIPAVIRDVADEDAVAMALIENIQREDLNPLEEARALLRLIEEFGLTHLAAAEAVGRSRAAVSNLLRLMELSDEVKELLESRQLEMGHARALLGLALAASRSKWPLSWSRNRCRFAIPRVWCGASSILMPRRRGIRRQWTRTFNAWRPKLPTSWAPRSPFSMQLPARASSSSATTAWMSSRAYWPTSVDPPKYDP